jgi:hypothetical protein
VSEHQKVYQYIVSNVFNSKFLVMLYLFSGMLEVQEETTSIFFSRINILHMYVCFCLLNSFRKFHFFEYIYNSFYKLNEFIHINLRSADNLSDSQCTLLTLLGIEL